MAFQAGDDGPKSDDSAARPAHRDDTPRRRFADRLATVILVITHAGLYGATFVLLGLLVMTTDPCEYRRCGDPAWLDRAAHLATWAGAALLVIDVALSVRRVVGRRLAWIVPAIGCLAQIALSAGAAAMETLAGPV